MALAFEVEPLGLEELAEAGHVDLIVDLGELLHRLGSRHQIRLGVRCGSDIDDIIDFHVLYWQSLVSKGIYCVVVRR